MCIYIYIYSTPYMFVVYVYNNSIYIYTVYSIYGTHLTSMLIRKQLIWGGWWSKMDVIQVPGIYTVLAQRKYNNILAHKAV